MYFAFLYNGVYNPLMPTDSAGYTHLALCKNIPNVSVNILKEGLKIYGEGLAITKVEGN
jgi:hypothetical protein